MSLIKEFNSLRQQVNQLFDDMIHEQPVIFFESAESPWIPAIELQEIDTQLLLKVQLPGILPGELDIQVSENAVFLSGEHKKKQNIEEKGGQVKSEFHYGQFKRVIPLPAIIQRDQVKAEMATGLLTLTMIKAAVVLPSLVKVSLINAKLPTMIPE
jgi:HSP20 family protein